MTLSAAQWSRIGGLLERLPAKPASYLDDELASAGRSVSMAHFQALERLGVPRSAMCGLWRHGYGFGVAAATNAGNGLYEPGEGQHHLILPVYDDGALVDLCAFRAARPLQWLLRSGQGWALGVGRGLEPHSWGDPIPLAASPLEWLQQGCEGLCVLDWDAPEVRYLSELPRLDCSSPELANHLRAALSKPARLPQISVLETRLAA